MGPGGRCNGCKHGSSSEVDRRLSELEHCFSEQSRCFSELVFGSHASIEKQFLCGKSEIMPRDIQTNGNGGLRLKLTLVHQDP